MITSRVFSLSCSVFEGKEAAVCKASSSPQISKIDTCYRGCHHSLCLKNNLVAAVGRCFSCPCVLLAAAERMEVWIKVREEDYMQLFLVFVAFSSSV